MLQHGCGCQHLLSRLGEDASRLRTLFLLWLWTGSIAQEVRILGGDGNLVLLESLGVKPHFCAYHCNAPESRLYPHSGSCSSECNVCHLCKPGEACYISWCASKNPNKSCLSTFPFWVGLRLQRCLSWCGKPIPRLLSEGPPSLFFFLWLGSSPSFFLPPLLWVAVVAVGTIEATLVFTRSCGLLDKLAKRLCAKEGTSFGTVSSLICSVIFFKNFDASLTTMDIFLC
jgi:hypothetical protein